MYFIYNKTDDFAVYESSEYCIRLVYVTEFWKITYIGVPEFLSLAWHC